MTMIGTVILVGIALFILSVAVVLLYMALMMALMIMPPRPEPRRKIQRTLYEKDWPRIMQETKIEKAGRKK